MFTVVHAHQEGIDSRLLVGFFDVLAGFKTQSIVGNVKLIPEFHQACVLCGSRTFWAYARGSRWAKASFSDYR